LITGNGEDGIQIIDYPELSDRRIRIERNLIARNAMAGIGCMSDAVTKEDYRAADIPEPIEVVNNTIAENEFGITGGDNLVAVNNVLVGNKQLAMKKVDGRSLAAHNLFWANGEDFDDASNLQREKTLNIDPRLDAQYRPKSDSPCVDAGIVRLELQSGAANIVVEAPYSGSGPDLGAFEADAAESE
jgi:hypothetical protein